VSSSPDISSIADIRRLLAALPPPDGGAMAAAAAREALVVKPPGALGRLEALVRWLAGWQGRHPPNLDRPRALVFAGNHGIAARGVSAYPPSVTAQMVSLFAGGGAAINQLCRRFGIELDVVALDLDRPTADFTEAPALGMDQFVLAFGRGMAEGARTADLLCLGEMGIGNTTAAAALAHGLFGGMASAWTGPGTGVGGDRLTTKRRVVADAVRHHRPATGDGLDWLRCLGGREMAAIAGAVLGARLNRCPVLLDGYVATAAAAALERTRPGALDHCQVAHVSAEPGHRLLLRRLDRRPLLELDMRLGEASGAALAVPLLQAAVACHTGMATFSDFGVDGPVAGV
jgi:nicotinate-nucleotide--dimethylbenzimidazole phosphoribosyltransferase